LRNYWKASVTCPPKAEVVSSNLAGRATVDEDGHYWLAVAL